MGKIKRIKSAVLVLMVVFSIFTGLVAAESPDVSNTKSNAKTISCPDYSTSVTVQGDISPGSDVDWYKCSVNSGDTVNQFLTGGAYNNYVGMYAEDQNGNFVEQLSKRYGNIVDVPVNTPPAYFKVKNDYGNTYNGYGFFIARNM